MVVLPASGSSSSSGDDERYCVRALVTTWMPDFFETLTREVANWELAGITLASPATMNLYSPYDGGMDVFADSLNPAHLEARFPCWMSSSPSKS
jgi:hypothetical protein